MRSLQLPPSEIYVLNIQGMFIGVTEAHLQISSTPSTCINKHTYIDSLSSNYLFFDSTQTLDDDNPTADNWM